MLSLKPFAPEGRGRRPGPEGREDAVGGTVLRGRPEEMAAALGLIRRVERTGRGGGLIIRGEAGIGKSALLTAITREAARRTKTVCGAVRPDPIGRVVPG